MTKKQIKIFDKNMVVQCNFSFFVICKEIVKLTVQAISITHYTATNLAKQILCVTEI